MIGVALLVIAVFVIGIWILLEVKRLKHRLFAFAVIGVILFVYFSGMFVFSGKEIDYKSVSGIISMFKVYFNWLLSVGGNFKSIATNAIAMDWQGNQTFIK